MSTPEDITYPARNISVSINRSAKDVYAFASNPENFPHWIAFIQEISKRGDAWIAQTSLGTIEFTFTPPNEFGIIDHQVRLPNGEAVSNPMRVIPNHKGCEFIFTLFEMPGRTQEEIEADAAAVLADLRNLKRIMETE